MRRLRLILILIEYEGTDGDVYTLYRALNYRPISFINKAVIIIFSNILLLYVKLNKTFSGVNSFKYFTGVKANNVFVVRKLHRRGVPSSAKGRITYSLI